MKNYEKLYEEQLEEGAPKFKENDKFQKELEFNKMANKKADEKDKQTKAQEKSVRKKILELEKLVIGLKKVKSGEMFLFGREIINNITKRVKIIDDIIKHTIKL